ncbi:MAG: bifunctional [glutamate--ammonia ligase]-adenylyl-L-tyrosine phosphorylase/[glutamate--ammonia-ligase] adenylyltransferase [Desulfatibacillaceae bacterium]|nr:bifunctional [glutamate--ammonia ligase]-adenylyl-L-tyrosine phosphorylase/[glutamate--ammonia-ligase] adenylyltransferase [Desulfatibacillaceae bacterium]
MPLKNLADAALFPGPKPAGEAPELLRARVDERLEALARAFAQAGLATLGNSRILAHLPLVAGVSDFVFNACCNNPPVLKELVESQELFLPSGRQDFVRRLDLALAAIDGEEAFKAAIRRFRQSEMLRIAWQDLAGYAGLLQTMGELCSLADAILERTLAFAHEQETLRFGRPVNEDGSPQQMVVMAMGKLGGYELNFSSDIDLIFALEKEGQTTGPTTICSTEFFTRVARRTTRILTDNTQLGFVYRVDLRLRPFGGSGPMVMSFDAMEDYYQTQGREWERYAWIKARPAAGDIASGDRLLALLRPFVFRRYLDYGAFESLREMKRMIATEVRRKGLSHDIKIGPGGIREVEFIVQALQLIRGGVVPQLSGRSLLDSLQAVADLDLLPGHVCRELAQAYVFLRRSENRLQEFADRQTHKLPDGDMGREALAWSMGYANWPLYIEALDEHRGAVHGHFQGLLAPGGETEGPDQRLLTAWQEKKGGGRRLAALMEAGFKEPGNVLDILDQLRRSSVMENLGTRGRELLDRLVPLMLGHAVHARDSALVMEKFSGLVEALGRRVSYLSLLAENPQALEQLAILYEAGPFVAQLIERHPVLLDELTDPRTLYTPPTRVELMQLMALRLDSVAPDDLEQIMDQLRVFQRVNAFRVAAADVTGSCYIMRVSDHLTNIAEVALEKVVDVAWADMTARHGAPPCSIKEPECGTGFCVIGLGKLGGIELAYNSDLDLVFLHSASPDSSTDGTKPLDSTTFFARLGQRIIHILTTPTAAGILYSTDMRLRPSGQAGVLVSHIQGFADYQHNEAWTWEHQALVRARPVAGDPAVGRRFNEIRSQILTLVREPDALRDDVLAMRKRMQKELLEENPGEFDLKQGAGGMVDIEFLVQYLVLLKAREHHELLRWTDNVRLLETIAGLRLLPERDALALNDAYLALRTKAHHLNLAGQKAIVNDASLDKHRNRVREIWHQVLES